MLNIHSRYITHPLIHWLFWQSQPAAAEHVAAAVTAATVQRAHLAFHRAYRRLAETQPAWIRRGFDDRLLRTVLPALVDNTPLPTPHDLALAWDRQFGILSSYPLRLQQLVELKTIAGQFLQQLIDEQGEQRS